MSKALAQARFFAPDAGMDLHNRYMTVDDLRMRARDRLPHFVWAYLHHATGTEATARRNREALDRVLFMPSVLDGKITPDFTTKLFGHDFALPFGMAPVGQSGLMWPGAEIVLAKTAAMHGLPYSLSTVATATPEEVGPHLGGNGWFQLYPPRDEAMRRDMLARARDSGFSVLVLTVDVPVASRREAQVKGGLTQPPRLTPRLLAQCAVRPAWSLARLKANLESGMPRMKTLDRYTTDTATRDPTAHVGYMLRTAPDWAYVAWIRDHWDGPLVIKGVLRTQDAIRLEKEGVDGLWVSNHAGRQFDAAPAALNSLPAIRAATALPLIYDSGIESGLDILRAVALGADMVMLGRAWHYALAALGNPGAMHLVELLRRDLLATIGQLGVMRPTDLRGHAIHAE